MANKLALGTISFLVFHFGGMVVFLAVLDRKGCTLPWLEQPDWCSLKAGAGMWEIMVAYQGIYHLLGVFM